MTNLDTKGWEQRFEKEFGTNLWKEIERRSPLMAGGFTTCNKDVESFIRQELSLAKKQWIEEIGKMKILPPTDDYVDGANNMLSDVLSYLKGGERKK